MHYNLNLICLPRRNLAV
uniref:Uncharacterized protein n=1 Tax=Rhizophora mucronata TaxID=61149 RepID=A0A2P2PTK1_RHIMU